MHGYLAITFEFVNVGSLFNILIRERRNTKLKRTARIDKQSVIGFIRQLHPTYIGTITCSLRLYIIMEHTFNSRIVYVNLTGLLTVGIRFMLSAPQIRNIPIPIVHLECQSHAGH